MVHFEKGNFKKYMKKGKNNGKRVEGFEKVFEI
jgi:hypothetical protein